MKLNRTERNGTGQYGKKYGKRVWYGNGTERLSVHTAQSVHVLNFGHFIHIAFTLQDLQHMQSMRAARSTSVQSMLFLVYILNIAVYILYMFCCIYTAHCTYGTCSTIRTVLFAWKRKGTQIGRCFADRKMYISKFAEAIGWFLDLAFRHVASVFGVENMMYPQTPKYF